MSKTEKILIECLENVGVFVDVNCEDIDLYAYDIDSLSFMSFIINIESRFSITVPDYMISYEAFRSLKNVANRIDDIINTTR